MSHEVVLELARINLTVERVPVPHTQSQLLLYSRQLVAVSDNITHLTRLRELWVHDNSLSEMPAGLLAMTQLEWLNVSRNLMAEIPREIGHLTNLKILYLAQNRLVTLPREICQLHALSRLSLSNNVLTSLPSELGRLKSLVGLDLMHNRLQWLPLSLDCLRPETAVYLNGNPLPIDVGKAEKFDNSRALLPEVFAATTALSMIREPAFVILNALQDLSLPALLSLDILDAAFPNSIPMHVKWNLVTAVKHFHERVH